MQNIFTMEVSGVEKTDLNSGTFYLSNSFLNVAAFISCVTTASSSKLP